MYAGVPSATPTAVTASPSAVVDADSAFATPKSVTIADPWLRRMLSGLMSRWTMPCVVRVGERARDLAQHAHPVGDGKLTFTLESRAERFAVDERHREIGQPIALAGGKQRHDVRMLQPRGELDLSFEALDRYARRHLGRQDFDHHPAVKSAVFGDEDARHAAPAQLALQGVGGSKRRLQLVAQVGHG